MQAKKKRTILWGLMKKISYERRRETNKIVHPCPLTPASSGRKRGGGKEGGSMLRG